MNPTKNIKNPISELIPAGIPKGHVVLLTGNSGTGKTTLALQWVYSQCQKEKSRGLYLAVTESITDCYKNVNSYDFYSDEFSNLIQFSDIRTIFSIYKNNLNSKSEIDKAVDLISKLMSENNIHYLIIDSITAIGYIIQNKELIRYFIFRLGVILRVHKSSSILISESSTESYSVFGVEDFISDGIIQLKYNLLNDGAINRSIRIIKMRRADFNTREVNFILNKKGIKILGIIPSGLDKIKYDLNKKISVGVPKLDSMFKGGIFNCSVNLVSGETGTGKTNLCIEFIDYGLMNNESCLYFGLEEDKDQIMRAARSIGKNWEDFLENKSLIIDAGLEVDFNSTNCMDKIINLIENHKPKRMVFDSMSFVENSLEKVKFKPFVTFLISFCKKMGITLFLTTVNVGGLGTRQISHDLEINTDNIIILRYVEMGGGIETIIGILKSRSSARDKSLRYFKVTDKGVEIGESVKEFEGIMTGSAHKLDLVAKEKITNSMADLKKMLGTSEGLVKIKNKDVDHNLFDL